MSAARKALLLTTYHTAVYTRPSLRTRRHVHISSILIPPAVFAGLLVSLWTWKSLMMVVFQNRIIYMPGLPPGSRKMEISDFKQELRGVSWDEQWTCAADGTRLCMAIATVSGKDAALQQKEARTTTRAQVAAVMQHVYVLYLQGNASSTPPRLGDHSSILKDLQQRLANRHVKITQVNLAYRGYWKSSGRPSEVGIDQDTIAAVQWILARHRETYGDDATEPYLLIWGQSIGAGFATNLLASGTIPASLPVIGVILETPFLSVRAMLAELYPERWVPYRYLHPFLRSHLDSEANLAKIAASYAKKSQARPPVLILQAGADEVVPATQSETLEQHCKDLHIPVTRNTVRNALHSEAMKGRRHIADFLTARLAATATANTRAGVMKDC